MKIKHLKRLIKNKSDDLEIYIENHVNPCGNIADLELVEKSSYGFFGRSIPCLILSARTKENTTIIKKS